jgi:methionyl-tRNA formyltransferase
MSRLAFLGSPPVAIPPLRALVGAGHDVALVVSQPDKRRGRGSALVPSPVKQAAEELGIRVTDHLDDVLEADIELGVVVAYGRIIPQRILDVVPMVNIHFSLLPRWRGAAPVERAILAGDQETGVCLMGLEAGLDTGPIHASARVAIGPDETAAALFDRLSALGAGLLVDALADGVAGLPPGVPQNGEVTYAAKLDPKEFELDWTRPADELLRVVRLGRAWTTFRGKRLRIVDAQRAEPETGAPGEINDLVVRAGGGGLHLLVVQPEGRGAQKAADWANGARPAPGELLGVAEPFEAGEKGVDR